MMNQLAPQHVCRAAQLAQQYSLVYCMDNTHSVLLLPPLLQQTAGATQGYGSRPTAC